MKDLELYQELVDRSANENSTNVLPNAGADHAAIVMAKLFEKTTSSVNMIVGSMDGQVSDQPNYLKRLEECINKNIPINVLFLNTPNENGKAFNLLKRKKAESFPIQLRIATPEVKSRFSAKTPIHYSVFDNDKYRFEKDTNKYLAWVCFNDPINAKSLNISFKIAFNKSNAI